MFENMYGINYDSSAIRDALRDVGASMREGKLGDWQEPWLAANVGDNACGTEERFWTKN